MHIDRLDVRATLNDDQFLRILLRRTETSLPVRLFIELGGASAEGTLISEQQWVSGFHRQLAATISSSPDVQAEIGMLFRPLTADLDQFEAESAEHQRVLPFLHLADVHTTGKNEMLPLLRVRTADIRAWSLVS